MSWFTVRCFMQSLIFCFNDHLYSYWVSKVKNVILELIGIINQELKLKFLIECFLYIFLLNFKLKSFSLLVY